MATTLEELRPVAEALRQNGMDAVCVATAAEVLPLLKSWLPQGATVAVGGSRSLEQVGVLSFLRRGPYRFLDRFAPGLSSDKLRELFVASLGADVYLASANAVTENGEIYCVDGNANRVAALCYGPQSVVLVVGCNKVVPDLPAAYRRVKTVAAPRNTARLHCDTPCAKTGVCCAVDSPDPTAGCRSPQRICCTYVTLGKQRAEGRIRVVLVAEPLGF